MNKMIKGAAVASLGVALLLGLVTMMQRRLIYFPDRSTPPPAAEVLPGARDVTLHTEDGLELTAWLVPAAEERDTGLAVMYLPGNGGNRSGRAPTADLLAERGFTVLLVDYRGYGGNPGRPSETGLAADGLAAHDWLVDEGYPSHRQIYVGESLGTGVAAALATQRPPAGLLLRSPFTNPLTIGSLLAAGGSSYIAWKSMREIRRAEFGQDILQATQSGAFAFLTKPVDKQELLDQVQKALKVSGFADTTEDWRSEIITRSAEILKIPLKELEHKGERVVVIGSGDRQPRHA